MSTVSTVSTANLTDIEARRPAELLSLIHI